MWRLSFGLIVLSVAGCSSYDSHGRPLTPARDLGSSDITIEHKRSLNTEQIALLLGVPIYPKAVQSKGLEGMFLSVMEDGEHTSTRFDVEASPADVLAFYAKHLVQTSKARTKVEDINEKFQDVGSHWETVITGTNESGKKTILLVPEVRKGNVLTFGITTVSPLSANPETGNPGEPAPTITP